MTGRNVRAGVLAATGLGVFYAGVIGWTSGGAHLADQVRADWPYLIAIIGQTVGGQPAGPGASAPSSGSSS